MDLKSLLVDARELSPKLSSWRRHIHAHPELSFEEYRTQAYVMSCLDSLGIPSSSIADTGVVAEIHGPQSRGCIGIRADMDALPIQEVEGRSYGSTVKGVMHACGHDVHTSALLGAAAILKKNTHLLKKSVKLIFQPGEERLPGGATKIIAAGGLLNPTVEKMVALHVAPDLPVGTYGLKSGPYMASADEIYLTFRGEGGHGALPFQHTDLIAITSQLITALQQVISRKAPPYFPSVLSFGSIQSEGGATNVLAKALHLEGTFRTFDEDWRSKAHTLIRSIIESHAKAFGAEFDLEIRKGYPFLSNDEESTIAVHSGLSQLVGKERVEVLKVRPTAEDFAWYLQEVPGVFFRLGVRNEALGITAGVHTPSFDVDEASLPYGAAGLSAAALSLM